MYSDDLVTHNLGRQLRILGACWLIYGIICFVSALWLVSFTNTATVMFGALLNRVSDPLAIVCGVLGVLAGLALVAGQRFGRVTAIIAALLSLSSIPLGTTLGIYSLI